MRAAVFALSLVVWTSMAADAQDARLAARLAEPTRVAVLAIIDSARAARLPTEPLVKKALEGASKGADAQRIIDAVRNLGERLRIARAALSDDAGEAELVSAAAALYAGVGSEALNRVARSAPGASVARRLVVLTDLMQLGVAQDTAVTLMTELMAAGASDADYILLRDQVASDIRRGAAPGPASVTRARGVLLMRGGAGGPSNSQH